MTDRGLMIIVSGPSGVGKDTVLAQFMATAENCVRSITATTRAPRGSEVHGRDYFFLTHGEFEAAASAGEMLEHVEYSGNRYGTPKRYILDMIAAGKHVIMKIDVKGALQIKKIYPDAVLVFIAPPDWQTLEARLRGRGTESPKELEERLATAKFELSKACEYDYIIINEQFDHCCGRLRSVVEAAECSAAYLKDFIEEVCNHA